MGIEQFFSSIEENSITNLLTSFTKKLEKRIETKYLHIDFNSIIYITSFKVLSELNHILYRLITGEKQGEKFKRLADQYNVEYDDNTTPEQFSESYPTEKINELVLEKIDEYLINIITNYVEPEKLQLLFIAVDGVPSKSKMVEQKGRRYMGGIMGQIKKKIFEKYEALLKTQKNRYRYEKLKIGWVRNLINPGTQFMDDLNELLRSDQLVNKIKKACPNLDQYIFSGVYEPGEGEQKIVDHLRSLSQEKSTYVIYSPDSDVTLLGLILNTAISGKRVSKLKILRHNQQKGNYDIINIDKLARNMYKYVVIQVGLDSRDKQTLDKDTILRDIVLMLTIFGNDFLPKLESFTVKQDFNRIIDKYVYVIKKSVEDKHEGINYVTYWSKKEQKHKINQRILTSLIKVLQFDEGGNLQKKYLVSHYQNYNWLKKMMGADPTNFTAIMTKFLDELRDFNMEIDDIRTNRDLDKFIDRWTKKSKQNFIKKLMKLTRLEGVRAKNPDEFIEAYVEYVERSRKLPKINILLRPFDKSIKDEYHWGILEKNVKSLDPKIKVTKYDEEMYKFDNMLDEYVEKLSSQPMELGKVYIDPKTYVWKAERIEDSVKNYYKQFFGIRNIDIENREMEELVESYIEGLMWVFELYFNNFNIEENRLSADTWYYEYSHGPLLTQIYYFLKNKSGNQQYLEQMQKELSSYKVKRQDFFNSLEHLMYVSPIPLVMDIVPDELKDFAENSQFYPDIKKIVDAIYEGKNIRDKKGNRLIDCRGKIFLQKCDILLEDWSWEEDQKFIKAIRKIQLKEDTIRLTGEFDPKESNVIYIDFGKTKQFRPTGETSDQIEEQSSEQAEEPIEEQMGGQLFTSSSNKKMYYLVK